VAWNGYAWVVAGNPGNNSLAYSSDGIIWTGEGTSVFSTTGYGIASVPAPYLYPAISSPLPSTFANLQQWKDTNGSTLGVLQDLTGNLGVGTSNPLYKLQVTDTQAGTASAMIENLASNTASATGGCTPGTACHSGLNIRLGISGDSTNPGVNDRYINFMQGNSQILGKIKGNGSGAIAYDTAGGDYAEWFRKADASEEMPVGTLVCMSGTSNGGITKCDDSSTSLVGVISATYGFVGNSQFENDPNYAIVGIVGQLPVLVSTINGEIKAGDALTASGVLGVAMKATGAGQIIGHALEDYTSEEPGKINVYASIGWYDPMAHLTASGNYSITPNSLAMEDGTDSKLPSFVLTSPAGDVITNVGVFSQATVANLKAGQVDAKQTNTESLTINQDAVTIAGQSLRDYIASVSAGLIATSQTTASNSANTNTNTTSNSYILANDPLFNQVKTETQTKIDSLQSQVNDLTLKVEQQASNSAFLTEILNSQVLGASTSATLNATLGDVDLNNATISDNLMVLGRTTVTDLGVTGNINAGVLSIHGDNGEINVLSGDLYLQRNSLGGINMLDGKIVIDTVGNMTVVGTVTADTVEAKNYTVLGDQSLGNGTIPAGLTSVEIYTPVASSSSKIFLTPTTLTDKQLTITNKSDGKFKVGISLSSTKPITFDWWIVGNK
jgi:hypothetical protein